MEHPKMKHHLEMYSMLYLLILILGIGLTPWAWEWCVCYNEASGMSLECHYSVVSGCYVKVNGQYVLLQNYRKTDNG